MPSLLTPYRVDATGRTATTADRANYARSLIETVLFTAPGERIMRPDFGAGVGTLVFDTNSDALGMAAEFLIRSALQAQLADVIVPVDVSLERDDGSLTITLVYDLRETGERVTSEFQGPEV